jgi:hypothetical protein
MRFGQLLPVAVLLVAGCASGSGSATQTGETAAQRAPVRRDRNVLLRTELSEVQQVEMTVYQAIRQFRPNMLMGTPASTMTGTAPALSVYVDDTRQGGVEALSQIRMTEVERIEYMNGSEATTRFGTGHSGGAIVIRRRR